jgi:hypothetical protein
MKYRILLFYLNFFRTFIAYLLCRHSKLWDIIVKDIDRNIYYRKPCGLGENLSAKPSFVKLGFLCLFDETFRNIVFYRLKQENKVKTIIFKILFPQKKDCELQCGGGDWCWTCDMSWAWNSDFS